MSFAAAFLPAVIKRFNDCKRLGDQTFAQLTDTDFHYKPSNESNSIAVIIQHFYGNALSRWTNFLTEDGEKPWRKRDAEFEVMDISKQDLLSFWNEGWKTILTALGNMTEDDLTKTIYIRSEPHQAFDAILRQLAHYSYHVGQVVYVAKTIKDNAWNTLSIPKGESESFNNKMMHR